MTGTTGLGLGPRRASGGGVESRVPGPRSRLVALGAAFLWLVAGGSAQEQPSAKVALGYAAGSPGRAVTVPVGLEGTTNVGRVVSRITFPAGDAEFVRLEAAGLLQEEVDAKARVLDPDKSSVEAATVIELQLSARKTGASLPNGIVAYLILRIDGKAVVEKTPEIVLAQEASLWPPAAADTAPPIAAAVESGKILLEEPDAPIIACFFYMH